MYARQSSIARSIVPFIDLGIGMIPYRSTHTKIEPGGGIGPPVMNRKESTQASNERALGIPFTTSIKVSNVFAQPPYVVLPFWNPYAGNAHRLQTSNMYAPLTDAARSTKGNTVKSTTMGKVVVVRCREYGCMGNHADRIPQGTVAVEDCS